MSNMLKCPNPSCPYVFDPSQVPVGVVLSCPRCAMQFTLGPPAPVAPASTTAAVAPNQPQSQFPPTEAEFQGIGATIGTAAPPQRTQPQAPPRQERSTRAAPRSGGRAPEEPAAGGSKVQVFLLAGVVAVLLAGAALAIIFVLMRRDSGSGTPESVTPFPELNIGVDTPPVGWTRDDAMRVQLGSPFVMSYKRENPEAYMAFGANAFGSDHSKGRMPRQSEMKLDLMRAFPKLQFDMSQYKEYQPPETKWLGEPIAPALGWKFTATSKDGLSWAGEAYAVSHKGFAYYWLCWCGEGDYEGRKSDFAAFRSKFRILDLREGWKESRANVSDFKGDKASYTITDAEDIWRDWPITEEGKTDDGLDKILRARITPPGNRNAQPDEAELRVNIVDLGGDPVEVARKVAEEREIARIRELNPDFRPPTFEVLTDPEQGDPIVSNAPKTTPVVRLKSKVTDSKNAARLIVASAIRVGDKTVVVRCWCEAGKRPVFESRFVQIASSLR